MVEVFYGFSEEYIISRLRVCNQFLKMIGANELQDSPGDEDSILNEKNVFRDRKEKKKRAIQEKSVFKLAKRKKKGTLSPVLSGLKICLISYSFLRAFLLQINVNGVYILFEDSIKESRIFTSIGKSSSFSAVAILDLHMVSWDRSRRFFEYDAAGFIEYVVAGATTNVLQMQEVRIRV